LSFRVLCAFADDGGKTEIAMPSELPKLPKLDKEDVKAVRNFLPGKILGRTAALLSLVLLFLGFAFAISLGIHHFPELEHLLPTWAIGVLVSLCVLAVAVQIILEWRSERNRRARQFLALKPGPKQTGYFRIGPYQNTPEDRVKFSRPDQSHWRFRHRQKFVVECLSAAKAARFGMDRGGSARVAESARCAPRCTA
jgi:hypothetical protein